MKYRARVTVEIRNGDGNYLRILTGDYVPVEEGHILRACAKSFESIPLPHRETEKTGNSFPGHD